MTQRMSDRVVANQRWAVVEFAFRYRDSNSEVKLALEGPLVIF